jgi:hypothetical protein
MADLRKEVTALRDPFNIKNAGLASSPYVLRKAFAADPGIRELLAAKDQVIPLIAEEMRAPEQLDDITLAALAFIVENVKPEVAPQLFGAHFRKSLGNPGPFFVYFAAHAIRLGLRQRVKGAKMDYSRAELLETRDLLR